MCDEFSFLIFFFFLRNALQNEKKKNECKAGSTTKRKFANTPNGDHATSTTGKDL